MGITYSEVKFADIAEQVKPMLKAHWEELANNKDTRPLDPDYQMYEALNDMEILRVFVVKDEDKVVGYSSWLISNNLHYRTWKYATCDVYYLDPTYRKTGVSLDFFFNIQDWLKSLGMNAIVVQDKVNHSHANFFNRLGYTAVEQTYEKVI